MAAGKQGRGRFRRFLIERVKPFTKNPRVQLAVAIILILTGLLEIFETVMLETVGWAPGVHHGLIVFGTMQGLYALTEVVEGLEGLELHTVEREVETVMTEVAVEGSEIAELERELGEAPEGTA